MLIGYIRVSKTDGSQTTNPQKDMLIANGVHPEYIYEDYCSGSHDKRPGFDACMKALREGDTLIVYSLCRLGRNLKHLIHTVEKLNQHKIGFKVLTGHGVLIDTTTPHGILMFNIFGALAEFERNLIIERTNAGIASARARGRFGGRPLKLNKTSLLMAASAMSNKETIVKDIAKKLGVSTITLYRYINGDGTLKEAGRKIVEGGKK